MSADENYDQPVAYDKDGRPLYAHPPNVGEKQEHAARVATQVVHMARPVEMEKPFVSDATKIKHSHSKQQYPHINLSEGEFVIVSVRRHPIGLLGPFGLAVFLITIAFAALFNYDLLAERFQLTGAAANPSVAILPVLLFALLVCIGAYIAYYVYINNRFYMTNECVIEFKQSGLFNHSEHSISLGSIEDASYTQTSFIQQIVGYGSIRLSTVGDETTYQFTYVRNPKDLIDRLNSAVEAFKNGRLVE
jgi:uncharacterized membrane protein YdbT with pleckstrin-like domain